MAWYLAKHMNNFMFFMNLTVDCKCCVLTFSFYRIALWYYIVVFCRICSSSWIAHKP